MHGGFVKSINTFKQFVEAKGAFKEFSAEEQPQRIPLTIYDTLKQTIENKLTNFGDVFIPSTQKSLDKLDTGDLDCIVNPFNRQTWREDLKRIFKDHIVVSKSNGPQIMFVMKDLIDDNQYMIDFILSNEGSFEYRKQYAKFGTIIPAVVGSFARSLRYKFDQNNLYLRLMSNKGNYHNIPLTNNFEIAMQILMLDMEPVLSDSLYTPEQVAEWVISSPRFDSRVWRGEEPDNIMNEEIKECYEIIKSSTNM